MQTKLNQNKAEVWSQTNCPACQEAKRLLTSYAIEYTECMIGVGTYTKKDLIEKVPNARSVPQIFIGGKYIGGLPELKKRLLVNDNYKTTTMG
jgi:glutaredoxin 3